EPSRRRHDRNGPLAAHPINSPPTRREAIFPDAGDNFYRDPASLSRVGAAGIQFLKNDGVANYNGMGAKLTQRFGTGLTTLLSYPWSKSLDDGSAIRGPGNDFVAQDARCRHCDCGYSTFDVTQRFVASVLYTLPVAKGQKLLTRGGIVNQVLGGWQVST